MKAISDWPWWRGPREGDVKAILDWLRGGWVGGGGAKLFLKTFRDGGQFEVSFKSLFMLNYAGYSTH